MSHDDRLSAALLDAFTLLPPERVRLLRKDTGLMVALAMDRRIANASPATTAAAAETPPLPTAPESLGVLVHDNPIAPPADACECGCSCPSCKLDRCTDCYVHAIPRRLAALEAWEMQRTSYRSATGPTSPRGRAKRHRELVSELVDAWTRFEAWLRTSPAGVVCFGNGAFNEGRAREGREDRYRAFLFATIKRLKETADVGCYGKVFGRKNCRPLDRCSACRAARLLETMKDVLEEIGS